jgi:hypothetical protein
LTKVKIKVSKDDLAKVGDDDRGTFDLPKPGLYVLQASRIDPGFTKNSDGEEDQSKPYLQFVYGIVAEMPGEIAPKGNYGNIWDYMSFSEASGWKRAEVLYAFGFLTKEEAERYDGEAEFELDTDVLVERKVLARVKHEKGRNNDDPKRAKIAKLFPYGSEQDSFTSNGETEYGEVSADDPFSTADEEGSGALLTVEELRSMELKELGDIAKEFDLDPNIYLVRNRAKKIDNALTMEAIISAILVAQNGNVETAEDEEESPF